MRSPSLASAGVTERAVIVSQQKRGQAAIFSMVTEDGHLRQGILPNRRLSTMKGAGYLRPFSKVYITLGAKKQIGRELHYLQEIQQVDGISVVSTLLDSLENIAYTSIAGELIHLLFSISEGERELFSRLEGYASAIDEKSTRIATIVLGWQLLEIGGFVPRAEVLLSTGEEGSLVEAKQAFWKEVQWATGRIIPISEAFQQGLGNILTYRWGEGKLSGSESFWKEGEELLFSFSESALGERLKSRSFLQTI